MWRTERNIYIFFLFLTLWRSILGLSYVMINQLINHGVAEEVIEKMKVDLQEFFKLPLEEKNAYARLPNGMEGYGQPYIFGQGRKLDWGDMFMLGSLPASQRNMKFWPENPSSFR